MCKLYSPYEEIPEELSDETDVDRYFNHRISDNSQSQHRIVRVDKGSKKTFAFRLFQFCDIMAHPQYIFQEEVEVNDSKRELSSLVDSLRDLLKTFDKASEWLQIPSPKPTYEIGSTEVKDNLFAPYLIDITEHQNRQFRLSFRFGNNNSCVLSNKNFEGHGNQIFLTEIVNNSHREVQHFYKNRYEVAKKCEILESNYNGQCFHPWFSVRQ